MLEQLFEMRIRLAPPGQPPDMRSRAPQFAGKLLLNKNGSAEAASYGQLPRVAAPSVYFGPWAGLISCWPRPQQLLPVSAAGGGRRRCSGSSSILSLQVA